MKTLLQGLYMDRHEFWAREVDESIRGLGTDERKLIYLVVMMNDEDVKQVQQRYKKVFKRDMLQQISGDIANQDWAKLLKAWLLFESRENVDAEKAADQLFPIAKGLGTD